MPRNFARVLTQIALTVGGAVVSATNGLPIIGANDYAPTSSSISALNGTATIACDGRAAVTLGITGNLVGTLQFEATVDGSTWLPMRCHFIDSTGVVQLAVTTTGNGVATLPSAGLASVRVKATAYTSGTATITPRASAAPRAVLALIAAMGILGGASPNSAVQVGARDGSGNLQPLSLGQALLASCLPVGLPATQDLAALVTAATGANVPASALLAGFQDNSGKIRAALLNAANVLRVQQDFGLPSVPWLIAASTTLPTAGVQIGAAGARVFRSGWVENTTGANCILFLSDRTSTLSNGVKPDRGYTNTITSNGIGSLVPTGLSVEGGLSCPNGIWVQGSSTVSTMTGIASTAISYVAIYS